MVAELVWVDGWAADLTELDLPSTMTTHFPVETDLLNFELTITPDDGKLIIHDWSGTHQAGGPLRAQN